MLYLLQLVQALKYENFNEIRYSFDCELEGHEQQSINEQNLFSKQFQETVSHTTEGFLAESIKIFSTAPSSTSVENSNLKIKSFDRSSPNSSDSQKASKLKEDLATFLINRACSNDAIANYFFWYLMVECEGAKSFATIPSGDKSGPASYPSVISSAITNSYSIPLVFSSENDLKNSYQHPEFMSGISSNINNIVDMYLIILKRFSTKLLKGGAEMVARRKFLLRQQEFVAKLVEIMKDVARESGNRLKKIEKLQSILSSPELSQKLNFSHSDPLPLPLDPNVKIVNIVAKEATLFKSTMMPAKLGFCATDGSIYYTIFKYGDDLRQDDLVLQMIILMDKLLRMENLDLKLTPYRVLACSSKHGFVQFIDSQSVAEVIDNESSIQNYLRKISSMQHTGNANFNHSIASATSSVLDFQLVTSGISLRIFN